LLLPLLAGAPGSAPVSRLARQVASSVLQAPQLPVLPRIAVAAPQPSAVKRQRKRAAAILAPAVTAQEPVAPVAAPAPERQGSVIYTTVSAAPPPLPSAEAAPRATPQVAEDSMLCRKPERIPGSRLLGPSVCLKASQWAALYAEGRTMSPDGRSAVALANYERARSINPPSGCTRFTVGAGTGFNVLPQTVCF
jgi:hypothetical protein